MNSLMVDRLGRERWLVLGKEFGGCMRVVLDVDPVFALNLD